MVFLGRESQLPSLSPASYGVVAQVAVPAQAWHGSVAYLIYCFQIYLYLEIETKPKVAKIPSKSKSQKGFEALSQQIQIGGRPRKTSDKSQRSHFRFRISAVESIDL